MSLIAVGIAASVGTTIWGMSQAEKVKEQNRKALESQQRAQEQMRIDAEKQRQMSQAELNKANRKNADKKALLDKARKGASSSTMLTGAKGINFDELSLGKNTLLGQ
ncbi:hypothetical protein [Bartonella queenslandensis]|uniref:hypothetical protein n=1 Tax=Bartonella queenslandensis TaxID=481138 RepID=UPI00032000D3|nr:hypothetical protein [Bartonella queenslandensis]